MRKLSENDHIATYGVPPGPAPSGTAPPPPGSPTGFPGDVETHPVAPNCERVCRRYPIDFQNYVKFPTEPIPNCPPEHPDYPNCDIITSTPDGSWFPPLPDKEPYWLCEWKCVGDQLNPWMITMNAIETLATKVQQGAAGAGNWIQEILLPTIYNTILLPWKTNWEGFITDGIQNVGQWLQENVTDKIPEAGAIRSWITDDLIPSIKGGIEGLSLPEQRIRFLFPLFKP